MLCRDGHVECVLQVSSPSDLAFRYLFVACMPLTSVRLLGIHLLCVHTT